jgi:hypothetical protein
MSAFSGVIVRAAKAGVAGGRPDDPYVVAEFVAPDE